jgi:hypothetical protein
MNAQCRHATWDGVAVKLEGLNGNSPVKADDKIQRTSEPTSDEQLACGLVPFTDSKKDLASFVNAQIKDRIQTGITNLTSTSNERSVKQIDRLFNAELS